MPANLILASGSPFRKILLSNAGLTFDAIPAQIDERVVEAPLVANAASPREVALELAIAKALDVSRKYPGAITIGSDQVLSLDGAIFHKCQNIAEAKQRLLQMSGKTHCLDSAIALAQNEHVVERIEARALMTFRDLSEMEVDRYLVEAGNDVLSSVGAYQFEGLGIRLFEKIEGDYFTIIGLPMLPLLQALRKHGALDA